MRDEIDVITITQKEYDDLLEDAAFLEYLRRAGVDNWDGYDFAIDMMNGDADSQ